VLGQSNARGNQWNQLGREMVVSKVICGRTMSTLMGNEAAKDLIIRRPVARIWRMSMAYL